MTKHFVIFQMFFNSTKKNLLHSLDRSKSFAVWFLKVTNPKVHQKCERNFCPHYPHFWRNLKKDKMTFLVLPMWCQNSLVSGHLWPLLLKSLGVWRWSNSKNFSRATFYFLWATPMVDMSLSYLPVKQIWRKRTVW